MVTFQKGANGCTGVYDPLNLAYEYYMLIILKMSVFVLIAHLVSFDISTTIELRTRDSLPIRQASGL